MPLVTIIPKADFYASSIAEGNIGNPSSFERFCRAVPGMLVENQHMLWLEKDAALADITVHRVFGERTLPPGNPDIVMGIFFRPEILGKRRSRKAVRKLKRLIVAWFQKNGNIDQAGDYYLPSFYIECCWGNRLCRQKIAGNYIDLSFYSKTDY